MTLNLNKMEIIGKTTINPLTFYTGKIAGYITWIILLLLLAGVDIIGTKSFPGKIVIAMVFLAAGLAFSFIALFNLGRSTRFGLPSGETKLKTKGLYKISRNPIYVGFDLITCASVIYTLNLLILVLGLYSIIVYHLIIQGEERFLISKFGIEYRDYMMKVRRYL